MPDSSDFRTVAFLNRRLLIASIAVFCLGGIAVIALDGTMKRPSPRQLANTHSPVWNEIAWPFPIDEWGKGKAFQCAAADCGAEIVVYLRPKIGFCNCTSGVADDAELDRVSDFALMGEGVMPAAAGIPIRVGSMQGRSRLFRIGSSDGRRMAFSSAFNSNCDVIVGTSIADQNDVATMQPMMLRLLNSDNVLTWAKHELGL